MRAFLGTEFWLTPVYSLTTKGRESIARLNVRVFY